MPKYLKWLIGLLAAIFAVFSVLFLTSGQAQIPPIINFIFNIGSPKKMQTGLLEVRLNEYGKDLQARSTVPIKGGNVAGATFLEIGVYTNRYKPHVHFRHGGQLLDLGVARAVMLTQDSGEKEPIQSFDISTDDIESPKEPRPSPAWDDRDRQVYARIKSLINRIDAAGWKRYLNPEEPRLSGEVTYFASTDSGYESNYQDPNFDFDFETWKKTGYSLTWRWYLDSAFLTLDYTKGDLDSTLRIVAKAAGEIYLHYDPQKSVPFLGTYQRGKAAYIAKLPEFAALRQKKEAAAIAAGVAIMSDWVDIPVASMQMPAQTGLAP